MKALWMGWAASVIATASAGASEASGGPFTLVGSTSSGGGGRSSGGAYSLLGAVGQPEAGTLTGGPFTLLGGFYGLFSVTAGGEVALTIVLNPDGSATLSWEVDGYTLEHREALNALEWQAVTPAPSGRSHVIPASDSTSYYRIMKP